MEEDEQYQEFSRELAHIMDGLADKGIIIRTRTEEGEEAWQLKDEKKEEFNQLWLKLKEQLVKKYIT